MEIRMLALSSPSLTWAARAEALAAHCALVPYLEDVLMRYEKNRSRWPDLGSFAGELAAALDTIPLDSCRAAPSPGLGLIGVARHRAVVGWMAETSPFRSRRLVVGGTGASVDGASGSAGGPPPPRAAAGRARG